MTVSNGNTKLLQVDPFHSSLDRVIGMVPDLLDRVKSFLDKNKEETAEDAAVQVEKSELVSEETAAE